MWGNFDDDDGSYDLFDQWDNLEDWYCGPLTATIYCHSLFMSNVLNCNVGSNKKEVRFVLFYGVKSAIWWKFEKIIFYKLVLSISKNVELHLHLLL